MSNVGSSQNLQNDEFSRSEARYRALVEATTQAVWSWSTDGANLDFDRTMAWWEGITGQSIEAQKAHHLSWLDVVHPDDRPAAESAWTQSLATGIPYDIEYRVKNRAGDWSYISAKGIPILGTDGKPREWVGTLNDVTIRRRAEEQLTRMTETLEHALAAAELGTWEWDPATDGMVLSPRAAEIYGVISGVSYKRENLRERIDPRDRDSARIAATIAATHRTDYNIEYRLDPSFCKVKWVAAHGRGVYDAAGKLLRMNGVVQDISARKQAEEELRDIKSRMEAALEAGAIGTWTWDIPQDRFYGDASLAHIFSLNADDIQGIPISMIMDSIHPEDIGWVAELVNRTVESGGKYEADYRVTDGQGSWRWVNARGLVERDHAGRAVRFPGVVIDITQRKLAEEKLAELTAVSDRRKRLYETTLNSTPDLVYVFDLDHRFIYANDALLRMWGRSWEDSIGKNCLQLGYEDWHAAMHDAEIDKVRATKKPIRGEVPFTGTNGRRIYDYIFVPVFGVTGEVEAVAGTTRDITDRQGMEQELRDADRKKDDFIALLAHELRNPLAPIRNGLQILRMADDQAIRNRTQQMMDRQLNHMVRLIDDLLDISRINRNKMELRRAKVSIADVINSAVDTARPVIDEADHSLTITLPARPVYLDADLTRLSQVFSNLLTNSAKYTPKHGRIWLTVEQSNTVISVSVRDNGIGIPAESLQNIFDMFSQVDRSVERNTGGLGIGLALVKGLIEMHGGEVVARSEGEGCGSEFMVTLPIMNETPIPAVTNFGGSFPSNRPKRRILVVDDNHDGAESLSMMLELRGEDVRIVNDGIAAVSQAEHFRPEIILMDVGMPLMDGLEATRRIRENDWGKEIKIIALTGWGQDADRQRTQDAGCDGHLVKPIEAHELEIVLNKVK